MVVAAKVQAWKKNIFFDLYRSISSVFFHVILPPFAIKSINKMEFIPPYWNYWKNVNSSFDVYEKRAELQIKRFYYDMISLLFLKWSR